jgi:hypothetical protein
MAYSLLRIFGIFVPLIYSEEREREDAFSRLHEEVKRTSKGGSSSHEILFSIIRNENKIYEISDETRPQFRRLL